MQFDDLPAGFSGDATRRPWDFVEPTRITIECRNCGLPQVCGATLPNHKIKCVRCHTLLAHCTAKSLGATLACVAAILILLPPALLEPFLTTSAFNATRTSVLPSSVSALWEEEWPLLALAVLLFLLVFPVLRIVSLAAVLAALRLRARPRWLGATFRLSVALQTWAMMDVFMLGLAVAYARLKASLLVTLDVGAMCFIGVALLTLITRATLDRARVWQLILPDRRPCVGEAVLACQVCDYWIPQHDEGGRCPRCAARVRHRRRNSISHSLALLAAAVLLYFPANLYPIATIPIDLTPTAYTVLGGVTDLAKSHLLGLALLVFCASFTIPVLKMVGLTWCIVPTLRGSAKHLVGRTRVYRIIEEIGRWSMVDPLTIACFVPVLHFNGLLNGRAEPAATPFAAVVIFTTLAVKLFDPRLMWDVLERKHA